MADETESTTGVGTVTLTVDCMHKDPGPLPTPNLFRAEYVEGNILRLTPLSAVGAKLLAEWMGCDVRMSTVSRGCPPPDYTRHGKGLRFADVEFVTRPLIASGNDPYYTGFGVTPDEAKAAREFIERRRAEARQVKQRAVNSTAPKTPKRKARRQR
jgi:hypothetical protein